jgi:hypothetical protein
MLMGECPERKGNIDGKRYSLIATGYVVFLQLPSEKNAGESA